MSINDADFLKKCASTFLWVSYGRKMAANSNVYNIVAQYQRFPNLDLFKVLDL